MPTPEEQYREEEDTFYSAVGKVIREWAELEIMLNLHFSALLGLSTALAVALLVYHMPAKAAVASSRTRILLADSRKFGRVTPAWFADLKDFDAIITDPGISLEYVDILHDLGIALHVV